MPAWGQPHTLVLFEAGRPPCRPRMWTQATQERATMPSFLASPPGPSQACAATSYLPCPLRESNFRKEGFQVLSFHQELGLRTLIPDPPWPSRANRTLLLKLRRDYIPLFTSQRGSLQDPEDSSRTDLDPHCHNNSLHTAFWAPISHLWVL